MKRKVLSVLLCAAMTLGVVAGCGSSSDTGSTDSASKTETKGEKTDSSSDKVTIRMSYWNSEDTVQAMLDYLAEAVPEVEIEYQFIDNSNYDTIIDTQLSAGEGPDIICESPGSALKHAKLGYLEALDDLAADYSTAGTSVYGYNGTGVGKTELVKQLASQLFDGPDPLIRLDMSEYMEKYAVSRMIGSPPGYVGYEEAGQLTEKVRRRPYSVVLFDEIEKAHPDVMNILLQILDEGKINDAQGRTVNFENTVICMTSNAGSGDKTGETGFNRTIAQMSRDKSIKALGEFLRPEFMSRVDEIVTFAPLSPESLKRIAALMLGEYKDPLAAKGVGLSWTEAALALLCEKAKGGKFGARDLRRVIRKAVEDPAAERIIDGTLKAGGSLTVDAENGEVILK